MVSLSTTKDQALLLQDQFSRRISSGLSSEQLGNLTTISPAGYIVSFNFFSFLFRLSALLCFVHISCTKDTIKNDNWAIIFFLINR
jgi:hypothetical protein